MPAARTKRSPRHGPLCEPYGARDVVLYFGHIWEPVFENGGYCKHIIGNLPVYGSSMLELYKNEGNMRRFEIAKYFFPGSKHVTEEQEVIKDKSLMVRQSCLKRIDDIYCHHYFKRCYISSSPQPVCREACEKLMSKFCDREFKTALEYNLRRRKQYNGAMYWDIINCSTLPFRNESSNCYYPNKTRGQ